MNWLWTLRYLLLSFFKSWVEYLVKASGAVVALVFAPSLGASATTRLHAEYFIVGYAGSAILLRILFRKSWWSLQYTRLFFGFLYWLIAVITAIIAPGILLFPPFLALAGLIPRLAIAFIIFILLTALGIWFWLNDFLKKAEDATTAAFWKLRATPDYEAVLSGEEFEHHRRPSTSRNRHYWDWWESKLGPWREAFKAISFSNFFKAVKIAFHVSRAIVMILIAAISLFSGYFLYTLYNDRSIDGMVLSCMGVSPTYNTENYTIVTAFNNPAPWSFHVKWLLFIQANVTGLRNEVDYFYINGSGVIEPGNATSYFDVRLPLILNQEFAANNFTGRWELEFYKFSVMTFTLTEQYTTDIFGFEAYSLHRFSNLSAFTSQSRSNNTFTVSPFDLASSIQFSLRTHFNLLSSEVPHAQLCPETTG